MKRACKIGFCGGKMKVAFLDRDGTINRDYLDSEWRIITVPEILDGSIQGMKYLLKKGYAIIIISNQYIIGEKIISLDQFNAFNIKLLNMLKNYGISVLDTFYCPHARSEQCDCCKPKTGLIKQAMEKYPKIDLSKSFMSGNSVCDLECAKNAGLKFYGINIGNPFVKNLSDLCNYI